MLIVSACIANCSIRKCMSAGVFGIMIDSLLITSFRHLLTFWPATPFYLLQIVSDQTIGQQGSCSLFVLYIHKSRFESLTGFLPMKPDWFALCRVERNFLKWHQIRFLAIHIIFRVSIVSGCVLSAESRWTQGPSVAETANTSHTLTPDKLGVDSQYLKAFLFH